MIRARTPPGGLVFPKHSKNNLNRILKFNLSKLGFLDARKFTSKAFHRGAANELLTTGNSLEVIKGSGCWWGSSFRSYVDLEMDKDFRISRMLVTLSDSSSDEDLPKKRTKQTKNRRTGQTRRKWRKNENRARMKSSSDDDSSSSSH